MAINPVKKYALRQDMHELYNQKRTNSALSEYLRSTFYKIQLMVSQVRSV